MQVVSLNIINFESHIYFELITFTWLKFGKTSSPSSLYYTLWLLVESTFKWVKCLGFPNGNFKNLSYEFHNLQIHNFFIIDLQCNLQQGFSNAMLHTSIIGHLTLVSLVLMVHNQIVNLTPNPSFGHNS
jgi:hypothetical protein